MDYLVGVVVGSLITLIGVSTGFSINKKKD